MLRKLGTVAMVATLMLGSAAWAVNDITWTGKNSNVWDVGGAVNWDDAGDTTFAAGDTVNFVAPTTTNASPTLAAALAAGSITVTGGAYTIDNATFALTSTAGVTISGTGTVLTLAGTGTNVLGAISVGTDSALTISAAGQIDSSALTIAGGALNTGLVASLANDIAVGAGGATVNVGADFASTGVITGTTTLTLKGGHNIDLTGATIAGYSGAVTLDGGSNLIVAAALGSGINMVTAADTVTLDGVVAPYAGNLTGEGGVVIDNASDTELTGTNTYKGGTKITGASTLTVSDDAKLGAATGGITLDDGTLKAGADFTTARNIALNGVAGGVIDTSTNTFTTTGNVTGDKALAIEGTKAASLLGDNSGYTGDVTVGAAIADTASLVVNNLNTNITLTDAANTVTYSLKANTENSKKISGDGELIVARDASVLPADPAPMLTLSGTTSDFTGGTTINAGAGVNLTGAIGSGDIDNSGVFAIATSAVYTTGNDITNQTTGIVRLSSANAGVKSFFDGTANEGALYLNGTADLSLVDLALDGASTVDGTVYTGGVTSIKSIDVGLNTLDIGGIETTNPANTDVTATAFAVGAVTAEAVTLTANNVSFNGGYTVATTTDVAAGKTVTLGEDFEILDEGIANAGYLNIDVTNTNFDTNLLLIDNELDVSGTMTGGTIGLFGATTVTNNITIAAGNFETRDVENFGGVIDVNNLILGTSTTATPAYTSAADVVFGDAVTAETIAFGSVAAPATATFDGAVTVTGATGFVIGTTGGATPVAKEVTFNDTVTGLVDVQGGIANFEADIAATDALSLAIKNSGTANINADVEAALAFTSGTMTIDTGKTFTDTTVAAVPSVIGDATAKTAPATGFTPAAVIDLGTTGTAVFANGLDLMGNAQIKGAGTVNAGSTGLRAYGDIYATGGNIAITATDSAIYGGVTIGANGATLAAVNFSGDVAFEAGSYIDLDSALTSAFLDTVTPGTTIISAGGVIDTSRSGWTMLPGGYMQFRNSVTDYFTLSGTEKEIKFEGKVDVSGSASDMLDSYWYEKKGVHTNGLYTNRGAATLIKTAQDIYNLPAPYAYTDNDINLIHLSGIRGGWWDVQTSRELLSNFNYTMGQAYTKPLIVSMENLRNVSREFKLYAPTYNVATNNVYSDASVKSSDAYASRVDCNYNYANGFFAGGIGLWQDLDNESNNAGGYEYNSGGVITGYAHRFGAFNVGAAFAYNGGDYKDKLALWNNSDIDNYSFLLSATYQAQNGFFAGLTGGYAYSDYDLKSGVGKAVTNPTTGFVENVNGREHGKYHSNNWMIDFELGYEWKPTACLSIIPSIGLSYVHTSASDFNARWAGIDSSTNAHATINRVYDLSGDSLQLPIDLAIAYDIPVGAESKVRVMVNGGYAYEFEDNGPDGRLAWGGAGVPTTIGIRSRDIGHNVWNVGAGLQYTAGRFDFAAKYDYYSRSKMDTHRLVGTVGIRF